MKTKVAPALDLARLSERIAETMGLHFPPERWNDLQRALGGVAREFGFGDVAACGEWLASAVLDQPRMQILARHLTIGETYFFREPNTFAALTMTVLPELIRVGRTRGRRLRLWSAACCTGEEPYSLAILLSQLLPDFAEWHITILGTDLNQTFLQKARAGIYGEWSFRDAPAEFKERYFRRTPEGRYAILASIRERVTFAQMNLVEDVFPALATDTNAMDLIFCRNVLMYFSPPQMRKVIANLHRALVDHGWLAVSPSEVSQALFGGFRTANFPGAVLYRKDAGQTPAEVATSSPPAAVFVPGPEWPPVLPPFVPAPMEVPEAEAPLAVATRLYEQGLFADAAETLFHAATPPATAAEFSLLTRALANQGALPAALAWCDRWLAADKLDAAAHYLRAMVAQELGDRGAARQALQRALYLRPEMVLAHFALGNLARVEAGSGEASRHFANALRLLRRASPEEPLPESDGLTVGRLTEIITSLLTPEVTP